MYVVCSTCNAQNPDDSQFCEECGIELEDENVQTLDENGPALASSAESPEDSLEDGPTSEEAVGETEVGTQDLDSGIAADPIGAAGVHPDPGPRSAVLTLLEFGQPTQTRIPLRSSPVSVGKFDPNQGPVDIDLEHIKGNQYLSRRHAELFFDGVWKVRDLGSTNGVFVRKSGQTAFLPRLQSPCELEDDDEVAFGNIRFQFHLTDADGEA